MSSASIKDITGYSTPVPDIKTNIQLQPMETIRKYSSEPHGMSLIALTMLDPMHKDLEMEIKFDDEGYINSFVEYVMGVWNKYEPITSFVRSYEKDGKFIDDLDGVKLSAKSTAPGSTADFNNKKIIIDVISIGSDSFTFKFYRWGENKPRVLRLLVKTLDSIV